LIKTWRQLQIKRITKKEATISQLCYFVEEAVLLGYGESIISVIIDKRLQIEEMHIVGC